MAERLIFVDRDGVINEDSDSYIKTPAEWVPIPGSVEALARLGHADFRVCVVSNQSGLGRGLFDQDALNGMHRKLRDLLAALGAKIEMIAFCPHLPTDGCSCRKPRPGLLFAVRDRLGLELRGVPFVGDSVSDVLAARAADMRPILVRTGKGESTVRDQGLALGTVEVFPNLTGVVDRLLD